MIMERTVRFEQTADALNHACLFHIALSDFYLAISNTGKSEKVKLLLEYMVENEKTISQAIIDYQEQAPAGILDTWFPYTNDADILKLPEHEDDDLIQEPSDVIELAMKYSDELIQLFTEMSDHSDIAELKELFDNLADMQHQEKLKLSMNVDRLMDL